MMYFYSGEWWNFTPALTESSATPKQVMTWAGHASIQFTMDVYGHLWNDPVLEQQIVASIEREFLK